MQVLKFIAVFIVFLVFSVKAYAQSPNSFNYQAVVRNSNGSELTNQIVSIKISIIKGSSSGQSIYSETHTVATNNYGLINIQIGAGSVLSGIFSAIEWGKDTYFVKTELDVSGGNNYELMGITQLLSVPYALHAKTAENVDDADADASNEIQTLSKSGSTVTLSKNGGSISINDNDADSINEIQTLKLNGNKLEISKGNSITLSGVVDLDADPTNELQVISVSNDTVYLTKGGYAILPTDSDGDSANELQLLSVKSDTLFLSKGNYIVLPADFDSDTTNEIQSLSLMGDKIYLSEGNSIKLNDNDSINEIQSLSLKGDTLILAKGNEVVLSSLFAERTYELGFDSTMGGYITYLTPDKKHGIVVCDTLFRRISWNDAFDKISDPSNFTKFSAKFLDWKMPTLFQFQNFIANKSLNHLDGHHIYWTSKEYITSSAFGGTVSIHSLNSDRAYCSTSSGGSLTEFKFDFYSTNTGATDLAIIPIRIF